MCSGKTSSIPATPGHLGDRIAAYIEIGIGFATTAVAAVVGLRLFPGFRSHESKSGTYRPGAAPTPSSRLPLVGGPAILIAVGASALAMTATEHGGALLTMLLAVIPFFIIGFADDLRKALRGQGIADGQSMLLGAGAAAIAAVVYATAPATDSAFGMRYWTGSGAVGDILFALWGFVLFLMVAISTGISDGVDGLTSGLSTIAALAIALAATVAMAAAGPAWVAAGASAGILSLNLPSGWAPRAAGRRRARIYLGDSGALVLGALLTAAALAAGVDLLLPLIAGVLILEGLSSVVQAKILVPLFRRSERLGGPEHRTVHHSEFPLPFAAAPFHHPLELVGLSRMKLVLLLWAFAAAGSGLALLAGAVDSVPWKVALYALGIVELACVWFGFSSLRPARLTIQSMADRQCLALVHGWRHRHFGVLPALTARSHPLPVDSADLGSFPLDRPLNPITARRLFDEIVAGFEVKEAGA